ncbi:MAG: recombinase family protein, partial [Acidimicrobiales bacterium]
MGIYARVSSEAQEARGTIGSQLEALRAKVAADGDELAAEFVDDGCSGARLDRPGLDALRDAVEAGLIEAVWCLTPDRLARSYAYQVLITDELARFGVAIRYLDAPPIDSDPQARLLTQIQAVVAEYERAKIIERYRRGKLYRARAGEVLSWRVPYGYHRVPRSGGEAARVEINETQARVVRRIFDDYVVVGRSIRQIVRVLNEEGVPASGGGRWHHSVVGDLLRNEAYVGRLYWNRTELVPDAGPRRVRQVVRPREDWICIPCPAIVSDDTFEAVQRACRDNVSYSTRRLAPGEEAWLLRGLVVCGSCGVHAHVTRAKNKTGVIHRYYRCKRRDPVLAGGEDRRCREAHIRADALDEFVFDQLRCALSRPEVLIAGEGALAARAPTPDDELLGATLAHLERKVELAQAERRRLADLYQAGLLEMVEVQRRVKDIDARHRQLSTQRDNLIAERQELVADNNLRRRVGDFAQRVVAAFDDLDFAGRQRLVRLLVEHVRVTGSQVELQLRIPLDEPPTDDDSEGGSRRGPLGGSDPGGSRDNAPSVSASDGGTGTSSAGDLAGGTPVSSHDRLRPLGGRLPGGQHVVPGAAQRLGRQVPPGHHQARPGPGQRRTRV